MSCGAARSSTPVPQRNCSTAICSATTSRRWPARRTDRSAVTRCPVRRPGVERLRQCPDLERVAVADTGAVPGTRERVHDVPAVELAPGEAPLAVHARVVVPVLKLAHLPVPGGTLLELVVAVDAAVGV